MTLTLQMSSFASVDQTLVSRTPYKDLLTRIYTFFPSSRAEYVVLHFLHSSREKKRICYTVSYCFYIFINSAEGSYVRTPFFFSIWKKGKSLVVPRSFLRVKTESLLPLCPALLLCSLWERRRVGGRSMRRTRLVEFAPGRRLFSSLNN